MPVINLTETGKKIKEIIKIKGFTVKDIADAFGFASPYPVYKWINGQSLPALDNLVVLAKITGVKMDEIIVVNEAV